ncbi:MAG: phosphohistidine phosphatase SixA [Candidatus Pacebacteria bacterium]|nr:phosphohistidine phosphatase SixA [Candidatus Paceibacterota bacterium]
MKLYLVQHAEAQSKDVNSERPLTSKGTADIQKTAAFADRLGIRVDKIYQSGKLRASQTAEILAAHIASEGLVEENADLKPKADPTVWRNRLDKVTEDIALVGHMPQLDKLASLLLCGDSDAHIIAFQNAGIVCLESSDENGWQAAWIVTPALL